MKDLILYMGQFVSEHRLKLFNEIIQDRTRYLTVVLEDIFQAQNASAVLRTCDCFGIQDVHIIENSNKYDINPDVSLGSDKWIDMVKYNSEKNNTKLAYKSLREKGYRIVATTPHEGDTALDDFDLHKGKTALVFGTELKGLSKYAIKEADEYLRIPMFGFTESFNISVSAAIILHHLVIKMRGSSILWQLKDNEKEAIKLDWLRNTIKKSELLEKQFLNLKGRR